MAFTLHLHLDEGRKPLGGGGPGTTGVSTIPLDRELANHSTVYGAPKGCWAPQGCWFDSQDTCQGCGLGLWWKVCRGQAVDVSPSPLISL